MTKNKACEINWSLNFFHFIKHESPINLTLKKNGDP